MQDSSNSGLSVRFWGVRGSIPCPGPGTVRYGGNTACVEVRCGDRLVIFDGGTGLRALGNEIVTAGARIDADIFFSHCHIDHVAGLPFFAPFYSDRNSFRLWAGHLAPTRLEDALRSLMSHPLFPVEVEVFRAAVSYRDFLAGDPIALDGGIAIRTAPLEHPGGATGYRLEFAGRSIAYLTDNEIAPAGPDRRLLDLARNADLAIYDCMYTDEQIADKAGWGHSSWRQGVALAESAGVKRFCLFHHAPEHDDATMDWIAAQARAMRPGTIAAAEGSVIEL